MARIFDPLPDNVAGAGPDHNYDPKHDVTKFKRLSNEELAAIRRKAQGVENAMAQPINRLAYEGIPVAVARRIVKLESEVTFLHEILQELLQK